MIERRNLLKIKLTEKTKKQKKNSQSSYKEKKNPLLYVSIEQQNAFQVMSGQSFVFNFSICAFKNILILFTYNF